MGGQQWVNILRTFYFKNKTISAPFPPTPPYKFAHGRLRPETATEPILAICSKLLAILSMSNWTAILSGRSEQQTMQGPMRGQCLMDQGEVCLIDLLPNMAGLSSCNFLAIFSHLSMLDWTAILSVRCQQQTMPGPITGHAWNSLD
jgi:hypothetical protein